MANALLHFHNSAKIPKSILWFVNLWCLRINDLNMFEECEQTILGYWEYQVMVIILMNEFI
jgi:hypothetical protein